MTITLVPGPTWGAQCWTCLLGDGPADRLATQSLDFDGLED
jgi:hypothetical protein